MRANRLTIVGSVFLAVAMTGAIWLITGYLFGDLITAIAAGAVAVLFVVVWYAVPLRAAAAAALVGGSRGSHYTGAGAAPRDPPCQGPPRLLAGGPRRSRWTTTGSRRIVRTVAEEVYHRRWSMAHQLRSASAADSARFVLAEHPAPPWEEPLRAPPRRGERGGGGRAVPRVRRLAGKLAAPDGRAARGALLRVRLLRGPAGAVVGLPGRNLRRERQPARHARQRGAREGLVPGHDPGRSSPSTPSRCRSCISTATSTARRRPCSTRSGDRCREGTQIVLDDFMLEPGWEREEHRAFFEFIESGRWRFEYTGYAYESPGCSAGVRLLGRG